MDGGRRPEKGEQRGLSFLDASIQIFDRCVEFEENVLARHFACLALTL
jgi:hypothetical protein